MDDRTDNIKFKKYSMHTFAELIQFNVNSIQRKLRYTTEMKLIS